MKRSWTRGEKALFLAPLLMVATVFALKAGPEAARRVIGLSQQLHTAPTNSLSAIVLSRDGSVLAAAGRDFGGKGRTSSQNGTIYLWNARTLRPLKAFAPQPWRGANGFWATSTADSLSLSPDGRLIGINGRGAAGYAVYEVRSQKLLWRTSANALTAQFSADGRLVALGQFEMREARSGKLVARWKAQNASMIQHFSLAPNSKTVAWIGADKPRRPATNYETRREPDGKAIEIRRSNDGKVIYALNNSQETEAVVFSPDGSRIVSLAHGELNSNGIDGAIVRCHSSDGKLLWQRDYRKSSPKKVREDLLCDAVFSSDGKSIAARSSLIGNRLLILNAVDGREKQQLTAPKGQNTNYLPPHALAFSPDGKRLFARGKDAVLVWDLK